MFSGIFDDQNAVIDDLFSKLESKLSVVPKLLREAAEQKKSNGQQSSCLQHEQMYDEFLKYMKELDEENRAASNESDTSEQSKISVDNCGVDTGVQDAKDELDTAKKLRECCDVFGNENHKDLDSSATCLLELGEIYLKYSVDKTKIKEQRENLIKSAALIVGAIVRYDHLKNESRYQKSVCELGKLHKVLFDAASIKEELRENLFEFSKSIKTTLRENRDEVAQMLEKNTVDMTLNSDEESRSIVEETKNTCQQSTKFYINLLVKIARKAEALLGERPCKFAVIGLGSLAKDEVTLYSDFEHAIVLEDGASEDDSVMEYFRWFTTIFHIIVIGVGETVIPSVAIQSLNNFFSDDPSANWFSDVHTPCGVSFDGMMPHASKIPLGRMKPTKLRKHSVELIQNVNSMVKYLTHEEEIKNGYFLSDVLSKTCFVFGDEDVSNTFCERCLHVLDEKALHQSRIHQLRNIIRNHEGVFKDIIDFNVLQKKNIKSSLYRPMSCLLSVLSCICGLTTNSSFHVVEELKERSIMHEETAYTLMKAVAITLQIRMRTYAVTGHQRRNLTHTEIAELVGEGNASFCYTTIIELSKLVQRMILNSSKRVALSMVFPSEENYVRKANALGCMGLFGSIKELLKSGLEFTNDLFQAYQSRELNAIDTKVLLQRAIACLSDYVGVIFAGKSFRKTEGFPDSTNFQWFERLLLFLERMMDGDAETYPKMAYLSCSVLRHMYMEKFDVALETLDGCWKELEELCARQPKDVRSLNKFTILVLKVDLMRNFEDGAQMTWSLVKLLEEEFDFRLICMLKIGIGFAQIKLEAICEARETLLSIVKEIKNNALRLGEYYFKTLLWQVLVAQVFGNFKSDVLLTKNLLKETHFAGPEIVYQPMEEQIQMM